MRHSAIALGLFIATLSASIAEADCAADKKLLAVQLDAGKEAEALPTIGKIKKDFQSCDTPDYRAADRLYAAWLFSQAKHLDGRPGQAGARREFVFKAAALQANWHAAAEKGNILFKEGHFDGALAAYVDAEHRIIEENDDAFPDPARVSEKKRELERVEATAEYKSFRERMYQLADLRVSDAEKPSGRGLSVLDDLDEIIWDRGIEATQVPVPILFAHDSDELSEIGRAVADKMVEIFAHDHPKLISIVGHTDQDGSASYNQDLSERRARRVATYLAAHHVEAAIKTQGRGKSQPLIIEDASHYTAEQIKQLNRRVEFSWQ